MKKWQVLLAALLLASGVSFRVLQQRRASGQAELPPVHVLPGGQVLPEDTTQYYVPEEFLSVPPRSGAPTAYGALPTIKNGVYDRGLCQGGSLNEILSSHGRLWGYTARHASFRPAETEKMYGVLGRYLSCVGLARRSPSYCDYLPGLDSGASVKLDRFGTPNARCREFYTDVSFPGFAAGREKSDEPCRLVLAGSNLSEGRRVPGREFCEAAAAGQEGLCDKFAPSISREELAQCRRFLPARKDDCGSDGECLSRLAVYEAMKAGDAAACPEDYRGQCGAFLSGSEASCSVLLVKLGADYCEYLAGAQKRARGYAGLSPEELKEALANDAEAKVLAAREEAESKKVTEELNKRVRRMMGRE
ncbi:MAG: hypothetical protein A2X32_07680 [Elusimicrobia bacterium GWC2_64_44]|nr:MAG: hypothetical protein A2X32_07680 [Elusimicrobia bacterium GWC2_64_44]